MKKSRYTDGQILSILRQAEAGTPVPELCREHAMSPATFYKWLGKPMAIRCDDGPEYISNALRDWAAEHDTCLDYFLGQGDQGSMQAL